MLAGQGESHEIFAGMLYRYITETEHFSPEENQ
jgi:hypothetical protein